MKQVVQWNKLLHEPGYESRGRWNKDKMIPSRWGDPSYYSRRRDRLALWSRKLVRSLELCLHERRWDTTQCSSSDLYKDTSKKTLPKLSYSQISVMVT